MKKFLNPFRPLVAVVVAFFVVSQAGAQSQPEVNLRDDQTVLVTDPSGYVNATRVGNSGLYKVMAGDNKSKSNEIFPILDYRLELIADDPLEPQSYLELLDAPSVWDISTGDSSIVVAVIDSGFALEHEDLEDRWALNEAEIGETTEEGPAPNCTSRGLPLDKSCNNLDDSGNGYVDDWRGWDFAQDDNTPQAGSTNSFGVGASHGTRVAGLVGITGNNGIGAASINWQVKILPLQVFTDDGEATTIELASAIAYAIDYGVDIINLSLGSNGIDSAIELLLAEAEAAGIIVVAAAGNCGGSTFSVNGCSFEGQMLYPATSNRTIAVAATNLSDQRASFSSQGTMLDIAAPGSGSMVSSSYTSTNSASAYTSEMYGTSFSAPVISGVIAHLLYQWSDATPKQMRATLIDTALRVPEMSGQLFTTNHGYGRVRPLQAIELSSKCSIITLPADINCDGSVDLLDLSTLASQWQLDRTGRSDINNSGKVDLLDLSILASQWGQ